MQVSWSTVSVVFIAVAALVVLAYLKVAPEYLVAIGALGTTLAGAGERLLRRPESKP